MGESVDTLDELLADPIIQLVMTRDGIRPQELRSLLERAQSSAGEPAPPPAHVIGKPCQGNWCCA